MKKQQAVILISTTTFIGILIVFGIIEINRNKKTSSPKPEPQSIVLSTDQFVDSMNDIAERVNALSPGDTKSMDAIVSDYTNAVNIFGNDFAAELRKVDPDAADQLEKASQQIREAQRKHQQ